MTVSVINPSTAKSVPYSGDGTLIDVLTYLGLTTDLVLALDAGDSNSYPGSGTKWFDVSGNGHNFDLMGSPGPAFNGTAGNVSLNEYWLFDRNGYFKSDETSIAEVTAMHKAGGQFSAIAGVNMANAGTYQSICGTCAGDANPKPGILWQHDYAGGNQRLLVNVDNDTTTGIDTGMPIMIGLSYDGTTGDGLHWYNGSTVTPFNDTNSAPSTSDPGGAFHVAARPASSGASGKLYTNSKMYFFALWSTRQVDGVNFGQIFSMLANVGRDFSV